jgi:hypothetical protein
MSHRKRNLSTSSPHQVFGRAGRKQMVLTRSIHRHLENLNSLSELRAPSGLLQRGARAGAYKTKQPTGIDERIQSKKNASQNPAIWWQRVQEMAEWLPERHVGLQLGRECKEAGEGFQAQPSGGIDCSAVV